ncbi:MAG: DUF2946 family protein [Rhodoferax sp.]
MDDIVRQAMAKWPHVPDCYGWLALDDRGDWYLRDDCTQALGAFDSGVPGAKGTVLRHDKLLGFIARNYGCDASGCWYFQNGPQRVFVDLQTTPLIARLHDDGHVCDHLGRPLSWHASWVDEAGRLYLQGQTLAQVHSQDMHLAADWIEAGRIDPKSIEQGSLPERFGFVRRPRPAKLLQ